MISSFVRRMDGNWMAEINFHPEDLLKFESDSDALQNVVDELQERIARAIEDYRRMRKGY